MYLVILFMVLAIASFQDVFHDSTLRSTNKTLLYCAVLFAIILLSSLRWEMGTDWEAYLHFFESCSNSFLDVENYGWMEPGYTFMNSVNKAICPYYSFHISIMAVLIIPMFGHVIYDKSVYPFMAMLVWLSMSICNIFPVRQTIAISLLFLSVKYIHEKQPQKFSILLLLSISFHYTAAVFTPAYFLFNLHLSRKSIALMTISSLVLSILASSSISDVLTLIGGDFFSAKLSFYLENSEETFNAAFTPRQTLVRGAINRSFLFLISLIFLEDIRKQDRLFNGIFNLFITATLLFILLTPIAPVLNRLSVYYDTSQILLIPYFFKAQLNFRSKVLLYALVVAYLAYRFYGVVMNYQVAYLPYKSILSL